MGCRAVRRNAKREEVRPLARRSGCVGAQNLFSFRRRLAVDGIDGSCRAVDLEHYWVSVEMTVRDWHSQVRAYGN